MINVIMLSTMDIVFNSRAKKLHTTRRIAANINIHGNSGTAIPAYQASLLGTGKKLTRESKKSNRASINRTIIIFKIYVEKITLDLLPLLIIWQLPITM